MMSGTGIGIGIGSIVLPSIRTTHSVFWVPSNPNCRLSTLLQPSQSMAIGSGLERNGSWLLSIRAEAATLAPATWPIVDSINEACAAITDAIAWLRSAGPQ